MKKYIFILYIVIFLFGCNYNSYSSSNDNSSNYLSKVDYTKNNNLEVLFDLRLKDITKAHMSSKKESYDFYNDDEINRFYNYLNVEYELYTKGDYGNLIHEAGEWYIRFYFDVDNDKVMWQINNHIMFRMFRIDPEYNKICYVYISSEEINLNEYSIKKA